VTTATTTATTTTRIQLLPCLGCWAGGCAGPRGRRVGALRRTASTQAAVCSECRLVARACVAHLPTIISARSGGRAQREGAGEMHAHTQLRRASPLVRARLIDRLELLHSLRDFPLDRGFIRPRLAQLPHLPRTLETTSAERLHNIASQPTPLHTPGLGRCSSLLFPP
jgi:hypothetical protein